MRLSPRCWAYFNPRPPRGGDQHGGCHMVPHPHISIHAPREGATFPTARCAFFHPVFQSTPPARGRLFSQAVHWAVVVFQSTPPARGRPDQLLRRMLLTCISIHAPREGATSVDRIRFSASTISIHAPREGATPSTSRWGAGGAFQSTPPARGRQQRCTVLPADL